MGFCGRLWTDKRRRRGLAPRKGLRFAKTSRESTNIVKWNTAVKFVTKYSRHLDRVTKICIYYACVVVALRLIAPSLPHCSTILLSSCLIFLCEYFFCHFCCSFSPPLWTFRLSQLFLHLLPLIYGLFGALGFWPGWSYFGHGIFKEKKDPRIIVIWKTKADNLSDRQLTFVKEKKVLIDWRWTLRINSNYKMCPADSVCSR